MSAEPYKPKELFIQKAKFFWKKGDQSNALKILERGITELGVAGGSAKDPKLYGDSKLLKARYNAEAVMVEFETTVKYFQEAISANKHCEEAYLMISEYKEKGSKMKNISLTKDGTRSYDIMETYAKSMVGTLYFIFKVIFSLKFY